MQSPLEHSRLWSSFETLHPFAARVIRRIDVGVVVCGIIATIMERGLLRITAIVHLELGMAAVAAMAWLLASAGLRYRWSRVRATFVRENRLDIALGLLWIAGLITILLFGGFLPYPPDQPFPRLTAWIAVSEILIAVRALVGIGTITRRATAKGWNPALILVLTFLTLVVIGTALLLLPRCRAHPFAENESFADQFRIALFTATSASCVTGLVVVPTGGSAPYWSRMGQIVILCLIQFGGFGIMTSGAFFAVASGRKLHFRESAALSDLLESSDLGSVRRLLLAILAFTLSSELLGAVLISGLWSDLPLSEQVFFSVFHAVSAFCNAGFSLTENSLVGLGHRWQVWGVIALLIITGGLGFSVLYDISIWIRSRVLGYRTRNPLIPLLAERARLTLTSKLVLITTAALLLGGAVGYFLLESMQPAPGESLVSQIREAWFQSVTFRTAGFNTIDHAELHPATKLFAIALMFIGASPGSTGGGIKTVAFVLSVLALVAVLKGRNQVEVFGRLIPHLQVNRALAIVSLGMIVVMVSTLLLVVFESRPINFIDHLFEATSAFATVGVSAGRTPALQHPSQFVLIATMFIGRVGPLTLMLAMATRPSQAEYEFPEERVTLG